MARKAEDYLRKATGMPPRPDSREGKKQQREARERRSSASYRPNSRRNPRSAQEPIIPPEYAEDVEFVETKEFSSTTIHSTPRFTEYHESQVSDAEWVEIKGSSRKQRQ